MRERYIYIHFQNRICVFLTFQVLRGKFEGFLTQLEAGEERLQSCSGLAAPLIRNKHSQSSAVREMLQQLRYTQAYNT